MRQEKQQVKSKPKPKPKQKIKTFDEYFQERIKNKSIPKDTPDYLKKALGRATKEYDIGIKHEKSALQYFLLKSMSLMENQKYFLLNILHKRTYTSKE